MVRVWRVWAAACVLGAAAMAQTPDPPKGDPRPDQVAPSTQEPRSSLVEKRVDLNLLGATDTSAGESRRNENVQFNLVDNNALKELNVRLGTTATIVPGFQASRNYYGTEFGNPPSAVLHLNPVNKAGWHGQAYWTHSNSIFSARSFFQVGDVKPAHDNDYGFMAGLQPWKGGYVTLDASQQKIRGQVNGNVLVPKEDERTPLASDPTVRAIVTRFLNAYPDELPNRTDINPRALNTNAPQVINNDNASIRFDQLLTARDRLLTSYQFTWQSVDAFELIAGQNPDTDTKSHRARITWNRVWSPSTVVDLSAGFDRLGSLLVPEPNAVGPMVSPSGLTTLGPEAIIPIDRKMNHFRYAGEIAQQRGRHRWSAGFGLVRRQMNGTETDAHRGFFSFANDFGRDGITNLRLGIASQYIRSIGNVTRGYRNWDFVSFVSDVWKASNTLTVSYGLRYQGTTRPYEVNHVDSIPYDGDWNNLAPMAGLAQRLPGRYGVLRAAGSVQFGEIFPVTFQQVRFSPPGSVKIILPAPNLLDPLGDGNAVANAKGARYVLDPELATPYSYQYNASWEPDLSSRWRIQLGYAGSRSHKLLLMWYLNRAQVVPGIAQTTATINQRRPDAAIADFRWVLNGSSGYFDAARVTLVIPRWKGLSSEASYWFSKALDLGASYTGTAYDAESRQARSQSDTGTQADMKGRSNFDQPHAFLWRGTWQTPGAPGGSFLQQVTHGWEVSAVVLLKQGTPFNVVSGSDAPGFGNVDGNGSDRPNLIDPSVIGRTIGDPDTSRFLLPKSAFSFMKPDDRRGNLGRNVFRKGSIRNVNAGISRSWPLDSRRLVLFRAESINLFNTPQFAEPGVEASNPNFGQITNTLNDGRSFRFGLQFRW
ncbi:MAG: hypothetical protein IT161_08770 [Bryobacterales bacterium]|nr:hypothetical protein [Bryobacterales bacterium]